MGQYQTFIVRFWTEESAETSRGHVQHVASGHGLYFRDLDRLLTFINQHLLAADPDGAARPNVAVDDPEKSGLTDVHDR